MTTQVAEDVMATRIPGHGLPQAAYVDEALFQRDLERVFAASWLFVCAESELSRPGDTVTWSIGRDSVLISRDQAGQLHAHHNVCRHRGCRLLQDGPSAERVISCPYHQWAYNLDGALRGAPHMGPDLPREQLALRPVALRNLGGLLFVCFVDTPPSFDDARAAVEPQLRAHQLDRTRVATRLRYSVAANWKMLVENNRECYHCRVNHPEFCLSNYDLGVAGDTRSNAAYEQVLQVQQQRWTELGLAPREVSFPGGSWFRIARLPLREGYATESISGELVAPPLGRLREGGVGSLRLITLPNSWTHVNVDYAMTTRLTPVTPGRTDVDICFLVRADAVEGPDFDLDELTAVWKSTSEQDWKLCEQNYAGVRSRGYLPGPLSAVTEGSVATFHDWYERCLTT